MKLYESQGLILRTVKYSETSIICEIYTQVKGLRSFIISGVRTAKKGGKAALFHPGNIVDITSYDVESEKLARLNDIHLSHHYQRVHYDIVASSVLLYMVEVARNAINERENNEDLYAFLIKWFVAVDSDTVFLPMAPIEFMIEFSHHLGFGPLDNKEDGPYFDLLEGVFGQERNAAHSIDEGDSISLYNVLTKQPDYQSMAKKTRDRILEHMIRYYRLHLPAFQSIKSLDVLRSVLAV